jgi:uncharacterized membrane protein YhaH (DUF805 family)
MEGGHEFSTGGPVGIFQLCEFPRPCLPLGILVVSTVPPSRRNRRRGSGLVRKYLLGGSPLATLFWLATIIPDLAVTVRRLHDTDSSGWWILLGLIPLIGMVVLIVWWCQKGSRGYNRFGADPLQPALSRLTASSRENR